MGPSFQRNSFGREDFDKRYLAGTEAVHKKLLFSSVIRTSKLNGATEIGNYRLAIFWAMYRISLRSPSSALLSKRRSLLRKRASLPTLPQAMSSEDLRLGRFGSCGGSSPS